MRSPGWPTDWKTATQSGQPATPHQATTEPERFRLLVDGVKDYAILMLDPQGRVVTWNEGAQHLQGYTKAAIIGQPMEVFYPQQDI